MEYVLVLRWLLVFAALAALGVPIAARLFPRFAGGGVGLALPVALVVLTLPAYWAGHLAFGPVALAAGLVVLVVASVLAALDHDDLREGRIDVGVDLDRGAAAEVAAVFVAAFLFLVAIRAVDPAVHPGGGEKFLDFGLLQALFRADALPPEDFWFAGESVAYYYGGHLVSTLLAWLTGTPPRYAYNLALAGFYATLVAAVYDLAGAVAADRLGPGSRRIAGAVAAFFVGIASNLATAAKLALSALPEGLRRSVAESVATTAEYTVGELLAGADSFSYWSASRVIPGTVNEFPLFAWLNGDLHAHMMGAPFLVLAAGVGYAVYRTPAAEPRRRAALAFGVVPVLGGFQAIVDTWGFPTVFGLLWLALAFSPASPLSAVRAVRPGRALDSLLPGRGPGGEAVRLVSATALAGLAGAVAALLAAPFLFGAATATSREVAVLAATDRSSLGALALVHGGFAVSFLAYLATRYDGDRAWPLLAGVAALSFVALLGNLAVLVLTGPLLVLGWVGLRMDRPVGFETVLIVAGAGLVTAVEFVYLVEEAGPGRFNTVFKIYAQVWAFWSVAAGVAVVGLLRSVGVVVADAATDDTGRADAASTPTAANGGRERPPGPETAQENPAAANAGSATGERSVAALVGVGSRGVVAALVVLLVLSTSVYGALALDAHFAGGGEPTLDATAFVAEAHPEEAQAIDWLDDREGTPTMVSAPGTRQYFGPGDGPGDGVAYTWDANPASSLTGVPTVAGWRHEVGYRGASAYYDRVRAVDGFFTGAVDQRRAFLRTYDVEYVWVGPAERDRYGSVDLSDLPELSVAHRSGSVTIYRVDDEP